METGMPQHNTRIKLPTTQREGVYDGKSETIGNYYIVECCSNFDKQVGQYLTGLCCM